MSCNFVKCKKSSFGIVSSTPFDYTKISGKSRSRFFESRENFLRDGSISEDCVHHIDEMHLQKSFQFHNGDFVGVDEKELLGRRYNARNIKIPTFVSKVKEQISHLFKEVLEIW